MRGFTWGKPCLLCLGVLESRSRLDLIFSLLPPTLPSSSTVAAAKKPLLFNPCCLFHFSLSRPMCRTHPTPLHPPPSFFPSPHSLSPMSPFSRRAKCQAFIRDKQLSPLLGGEKRRQTEWRQEKREMEEKLWKRKERREDTDEGRQDFYDVSAAFEL